MDVIRGMCWKCKEILPEEDGVPCELCKVARYCSAKCRYHDVLRHTVECNVAIKALNCWTCHKAGVELKRCSACCIAMYCSKECQELHWPHHKANCSENVKTAKHFPYKKITPFTKCSDLPWYVGASMAEDYLQLPFNEGVENVQSLNLLFVGVGDIRDVVRTVVDLPESFNGRLQFVLSDLSAHVMARNFLFLYCGLARQNYASFLPHIWYSFLLTHDGKKFIVSVLKSLVKQTRTAVLREMSDVVTIKESHWDACQDIWKGWLKLTYDTEAVRKMKRTRNDKMHFPFFHAIIYDALETVPRRHYYSIESFINDGIFLPLGSLERFSATFVNPTMACYNPFNMKHHGKYPDINTDMPMVRGWGQNIDDQDDMVYGVRADAHVLNCWDYLRVKDSVILRDDVLAMYTDYLTDVFQKFFDKIKSLDIRFRFVVGDFKILHRHLDTNEHFDRICTSNLGDYFTFALLLETFGKYLNKNNEHSVLITHHQNWFTLRGTEIERFTTLENLPLILQDVRDRPEVLHGLGDTARFQAVQTYPFCRGDYWNNYPDLLFSLFGEILDYYQIKSENLPKKTSLVHPSEIAVKLGLRFRDFRIEPNHVIPFRHEGNIRRVSMAHYSKRHLEWTPRKN